MGVGRLLGSKLDRFVEGDEVLEVSEWGEVVMEIGSTRAKAGLTGDLGVPIGPVLWVGVIGSWDKWAGLEVRGGTGLNVSALDTVQSRNRASGKALLVPFGCDDAAKFCPGALLVDPSAVAETPDFTTDVSFSCVFVGFWFVGASILTCGAWPTGGVGLGAVWTSGGISSLSALSQGPEALK